MNDQDYIRKAVEIADGWKWIGSYDDGIDYAVRAAEYEFDKLDTDQQIIRDALAAQLVRQIDTGQNSRIVSTSGGVSVMTDYFEEGRRIGYRCVAEETGPDRTMNAIKAIIDSEVLEQ